MAFFSVVALPGSAFGSVIGQLAQFLSTALWLIHRTNGAPTIAYAVVAKLTWRWTFYIGIISNGWALLLVLLFYWPPDFLGLHPEGKTRWQQFKELDFVGLTLFGGGLTAFLLGLSFGNNPYPWISATVLAPLIIGGK